MKASQVVWVVILCLITAFGTVTYINSTPSQSAAVAKETTYDRVVRTGIIRCGYSIWDPLFYIDPKTNEKMGIFYDEMEELAKRLDLKIIWQEELGWGSVVEAVKSGRVDASCSGYWLNPGRIKNLSASISQLYAPLYIWMRQDDARALTGPDDLNSDQYTVATVDGSAESQIIAARFHQAKRVSVTELGTSSDILENLVDKKADFIISDAGTMSVYIRNNPGKIKNTFPNQPVNVFPNVILLPPDDVRFKEVIDNTLHNIEYDGTLDVILKKYHMEQGFLRNPLPVKLNP